MPSHRRPIETQRSVRKPRAYTPSLFPPAASHGATTAGSDASQPPLAHNTGLQPVNVGATKGQALRSFDRATPLTAVICEGSMNSPLASKQGFVQITPFKKDCMGQGLRSFDRESNSLSAIYEGEQNPPPFFAASPSASQSRNASRTDEVAPACNTDFRNAGFQPATLPSATHAGRLEAGVTKTPREQLVGIARLAADSPLTQHKRATEYFELPVRSVLNKCDAPRVPFEWSINPYRGCEFGCVYCYARYTHEFMELDGHDFEKKIFVKKNAAALLARDIEEQSARVTSRLGEPEAIALGTATDPYQPAERDFGVTRGLLEKMAEREGLDLSITTKSDLIVRDIDVLKRIHERSQLSINLTITTPRRNWNCWKWKNGFS